MSINKRIGSGIRNSYKKFERWRFYKNSRTQAKNNLRELLKRKDQPFVTSELKKEISRYAEHEFGNKKYSLWLELYSELRGEFIKGWIPDDYYTYELIPMFNPKPLSMLSTLKSFDHRLYPMYSIQPLGLKISGSYFTAEMEDINFSDLKNRLEAYNEEVVIKRDDGPSGKEILFKQSSEVSENDFLDNEDYVIQPGVKQHQNLEKIYKHSVNTIRIGTFLTNKGEVKVILSILRFGRGGTRVDNLVAGGGFISINDEGKGGSTAYNYSGNDIGKTHPDTGFKFENVQIPSFKNVLNICKESHLRFPYDRYIAWDVCITNEGRVKFLEWNTRMPGFWFYEARLGPLWDKRWF